MHSDGIHETAVVPPDPLYTTIYISERIPNGHSFNILHMEGIVGKLIRAGITQNEMKSGEGYSK